MDRRKGAVMQAVCGHRRLTQIGVAKTRGFREELSDVAIEYGREFSVEGVRVVHQVLRFGRGRRSNTPGSGVTFTEKEDVLVDETNR